MTMLLSMLLTSFYQRKK